MARTSETVRLTGQQFHHYLVVRDLRPDDVGKQGDVWCRCIPCGGERSVKAAALLSGRARGCLPCLRTFPTAMAPTERQDALRARRRGDGLCPRCGSTPVEGAASCRKCLDKARDRYRAKQGTVRVIRCRFCNEAGHTASTCTAPAVAAEAAS